MKYSKACFSSIKVEAMIKTRTWNYIDIPIVDSVFPGGEEYIRLDREVDQACSFKITARLQSSKSIMQLLMVKNALDNAYPKSYIEVVIPYLPYARQDRVCSAGEAFSLEVMLKIIDSMKFNHVQLFDVHNSGALTSLESICDVKGKWDILKPRIGEKIRGLGGDLDLVLVSPDRGAELEVNGIAKNIRAIAGGSVRVVLSHKERSPDGLSISIKNKIISDKYFIIDDIYDGGMTFIKLAEQLKEINPASKIYLYVTHGIFSKGLEVFDGLIDKIYTTNTFETEHESEKLIKEKIL